MAVRISFKGTRMGTLMSIGWWSARMHWEGQSGGIGKGTGGAVCRRRIAGHCGKFSRQNGWLLMDRAWQICFRPAMVGRLAVMRRGTCRGSWEHVEKAIVGVAWSDIISRGSVWSTVHSAGVISGSVGLERG